MRGQGRDDEGLADDPRDAQGRQGEEPDTHHRPEGLADDCRPSSLHDEQDRQDDDRGGQNDHLGARIGHRDAFHRAHHRDRWGDEGISVEQAGADDAEQHCRHASALAAGHETTHQGHQREDTALTVVVSTHHEDDVLDAHHQQDRPEDHRDDPHDVTVGGSNGMVLHREHRLKGVEHRGSDVTKDDSQRSQGQPRLHGSDRFRISDRLGGLGHRVPSMSATHSRKYGPHGLNCKSNREGSSDVRGAGEIVLTSPAPVTLFSSHVSVRRRPQARDRMTTL